MATYTYSERRQRTTDTNSRIDQFLRRNWFECLVILGLLYVVMCRDISFTIGYQAPAGAQSQQSGWNDPNQSGFALLSNLHRGGEAVEDNPVDLIDDSVIPAELGEEEAGRLEVCQAFVQRFAKVAIAEQEKYGIPASITLAISLYRSKAGEAPAATEANNFFASTCESGQSCYTMNDLAYARYTTPWESFRAHSLVLRSDAYSGLARLRQDDYEGWASGLARIGYLHDQAEAEKVVQIIESLELFLFDRAQL